MSEADDIVRLRHMLDAARKAVELTERSKRGDLDTCIGTGTVAGGPGRSRQECF